MLLYLLSVSSCTDLGDTDIGRTNGEPEGMKGHNRNDSYTSQQSRGSTGYVSLTHSRQSSVGSEKNPISSHTRYSLTFIYFGSLYFCENQILLIDQKKKKYIVTGF